MQAGSGHDFRRYFAHYPSLDELMRSSQSYVENWVIVFYATLYITDQRHFIQFMFDDREYRMHREKIAELLGFPLRGVSVHSIVYDAVSPPYRGHPGQAPLVDHVRHLFRGPLHADTPRTPNCLRLEFQLLL